MRTGVGTPSSMPAWMVQRPSPESETRPAYDASPGSPASAPAVRSSSHDPMTLPRRHSSATSGEVELVPVMRRLAQRGGLRVHLRGVLPDRGAAQDVEPLGVRRHHPVLDAVVDHLDEVAGTRGSAVQVAVLGGAAPRRPAGRRGGGGDAGGERCEDRGRDGARARPRPRSSGSSRARAPTPRRSCPRRRSAGPSAPARRRGAGRRRTRSCRRRSGCRPPRAAAPGRRSSPSTAAAGTIIQTARGAASACHQVGEGRRPPRRPRAASSATGVRRTVEDHALVSVAAAAVAPCWRPCARVRSSRSACHHPPRIAR